MPRKKAHPVEPEAPAASSEVENIIPGTELHLGDGRKLQFGESAPVSAALAVFLRGRGQAK